MSGGEGMRWIIGRGSKGVVPRIARCFAVGLRCVVSRCDGLPAETGSRPGGRGTFFVRTKKVPKESRPASTPRASRAVPCAARSIGCLRNSPSLTLGARTVLATAALCASEPVASVLLGVSEGEGEASTFLRCRVFVARLQAAGRNAESAAENLEGPAPDSAPLNPSYEYHPSVAQRMVLTLGPVESVEWHSGVGGSARRADGEDRLRPAGPSSAAARLCEHAREVRRSRLTANAGSPFLGYFFWRSKRSNRPAGGGTPANARLQTNICHREPQPTSQVSVGVCSGQPCVTWSTIDGAHRRLTWPCMTIHQNHRRAADRGICHRNANHNRTPPQRRHSNIIGGDECSTRS